MHYPRKRFGQHFLHDQSVIHRIITALNPKPNDHLVEIGPGEGALTFPLLKCVPSLDAIEFDRDLIVLLHTSADQTHLNLIQADALNFDFAQLKNDERPLRMIGNLPYNISTPLIFHLLTFKNVISDMLFMLQKEVAERLAAAPRSSSYGRLSVMVQYHCVVMVLFDVSPRSFSPPPKVQSSIVKLIPHQHYPYLAKDELLFAEVVRRAFNHRRKTLRNSLKGLVSDDIWQALSIHSDLRPETLSIENFVSISNALSNQSK